MAKKAAQPKKFTIDRKGTAARRAAPKKAAGSGGGKPDSGGKGGNAPAPSDAPLEW